MRDQQNVELLGLCQGSVGAMFGPFWTILDNVWPSFPFRPARALKFSRLGNYGLSIISIECLLFGPYLGHVGAILHDFGPCLA